MIVLESQERLDDRLLRPFHVRQPRFRADHQRRRQRLDAHLPPHHGASTAKITTPRVSPSSNQQRRRRRLMLLLLPPRQKWQSIQPPLLLPARGSLANLLRVRWNVKQRIRRGIRYQSTRHRLGRQSFGYHGRAFFRGHFHQRVSRSGFDDSHVGSTGRRGGEVVAATVVRGSIVGDPASVVVEYEAVHVRGVCGGDYLRQVSCLQLLATTTLGLIIISSIAIRARHHAHPIPLLVHGNSQPSIRQSI
mmetsp:Transcript_8224/g.17834  ORF Transcript_8224/g.17834 Transcript_8224/m.17834 type:complete len:248 (-) Transcript_8224:1443-2186(-)